MSGKKGVFICPSCQAVVKSDRPLHEGVTCGECLHVFGSNNGSPKAKSQIPGGKKERGSSGVVRDLIGKKSAPILPVGVIDAPKMSVRTLEQARLEQARNESVDSSSDDETIMPDGSRRVRRRKKREKAEKNKGLIIFLGAWVCIVIAVLVIFATGKFGAPEISNATVVKEDTKEGRRNLMDQQIVNASREKIKRDFKAFMKLPEGSGQTQFIDNPAEFSLAFRRYYEETALFPRASGTLTQTGVNVLKLPKDELAVESIWKDSEGHQWGALHLLDKTTSRWKLDWENFAPYSTASWSKFINQLDGSSNEGTFRLLVRKRRTADDDKKISLSFYRAPHVKEGDGEFKKSESPEIDLLVGSDLEIEFMKLWKDHQEENDPMGSMLGRALDPEPRTYMRITVRLGWKGDKRDENVLELKEIVGAGWFGERIIRLRQSVKDAAAEEPLTTLSESSGKEQLNESVNE